MMSEHIQDILDQCVDAVVAGEESIDSCCARYPELAPVLEPLMDIEIQARAALAVAVGEQAKAGAREAVLARARDLSGARADSSRWTLKTARHRLSLRPVAIAATLMAFMFTGTAVAATMAGPDSILYPLKQQMEAARTVLALQDADKAAVEIGYANARLDEVAGMVADNKPEYVPALLDRYDSHMDAAAALMDKVREQGGDTDQMEALITSTRYRHDYLLMALSRQVPAEVGDIMRRSVTGDTPDTVPSAPGSGNAQPPRNAQPPAAAGDGMPDESRDQAPADTPEGMENPMPDGSDTPYGVGVMPEDEGADCSSRPGGCAENR